MLKYIVFFYALLQGGWALAQTPKFRPLTTAPFQSVLLLNHEVTQDGLYTSKARVGPLAGSSTGLTTDRLSTNVSTYDIGQLPVIAVSNPAPQAGVLLAAADWLRLNGTAHTKKVGAYLKKNGIPSAIVTYNQDFMMSTTLGSKKMAISWTATVDPDGRAVYGNPKIVDPSPTYVMAIYYPLKAASGLPASWGQQLFVHAGKLRYALLNRRFEELTGWYEIQTGGAFDADSSSSESVSCLMDLRYPGCSGPIDIRTILDQFGASAAFVDYVRQAEPEMAYNPTTDDFSAKGAISYDTRVMTCETLTNTGFYGYILRFTAERYIAEPTTSLVKYQVLEQYSGKGLSPTEPFSKEVSLSALQGRSPDQFVISPHPNDTSFWDRSDAVTISQVIYVAPLKADTEGNGVLAATQISSDMAVTELSHQGQVREYYVGTIGDNYWGSGIYDRAISFNLKDPQSTEEFAITQQGFDDWMLLRINGQVVYVGPYGGDMLEYTDGGRNSVYLDSQTNCYPQEYGYGWTCNRGEFSTPTTYTWCSRLGGEDNPSGYQCGTGCVPGTVQYTSQLGVGCGSPELGRNWVFENYLDLRPYLRAGANSISFRVIVAGNGEGWIRIRTKTCSAGNFATEGPPPPVPPGAGSNGVIATNQENLR